MKNDNLVDRLVEEGIIDAPTVAQVRDLLTQCRNPNPIHLLMGVAALAALFLIGLIVASNWGAIPPFVKIGAHASTNGLVAFSLYYMAMAPARKAIWVNIAVLALAFLTLTFIVVVNQIYQVNEPAWKTLALWLALTTPFWLVLAEGKAFVRLWVLSFLVAYAVLLKNGIGFDHGSAKLFIMALLPFCLIAVGQSRLFRTQRELTAQHVNATGFLIVSMGAYAAQFMWGVSSENYGQLVPVFWQVAGIAGAAALGIVCLRSRGGRAALSMDVDAFLVLSVAVCAAPFLIPHEAHVFLGALLGIAYLSLCGWVAVRNGHPHTLFAVVILVALSLVEAYVTLCASFLQTGIGKIISFILLLALVAGARSVLISLRTALGGKKS